MIKLFRGIRKQLLTENKLGKYFVYAFGEIVLVVIGILIALQINNWNNERNNRKLEKEYLRGIQYNLIEDIAELEGHFDTDTVQLDAYTYLVRTVSDSRLKDDKKNLIRSFYQSFGLHWFEGQNVVFEDLKSSGKIYLIQSDSLKLKIQEYYSLFQEVIK